MLSRAGISDGRVNRVLRSNDLLKRSGLLACSVIALEACTTPAVNRLPVQIGGEEEFDACLGVGRMVALPGSSAPLEVRARPELDAPITGYVDPGAFIWMCELTDDRAWHGILHSHREDGRISCEVSSPIAERQDYSGPCQQGWVEDETIFLFAD